MRVEPSQLIAGCVLLSDVWGKSNKPIVPKRTVITEEHITVLHKFMIDNVDVAAKLHDGEIYTPKPMPAGQDKKPEVTSQEQNSFEDQYIKTVKTLKKLFTAWQNNSSIKMPLVRKALLPLFERAIEQNAEVYTLHKYAVKEDYFFHHSVAVGILSAYLANKMGYEKGEWLQIGLAGALGDCGMSKMDYSIIERNGPLTFQELQELKKHPTYSYRLVEKTSTITKEVKLAILQHHERMDGSGYPFGLEQSKIHMYARIIAVCDTYHAMTSERNYQGRKSSFQVIEELQKDQFTKLDHRVVNIFINSLTSLSIGKKVRLSTGQEGQIVFMEANQPARPMVKIDESEEIITLKDNPGIYISDIIGD
ncbi:HD-GYP domain-containing protein [Virgibacillus kekensis]|uniref:HD-GYP domain-containing protein n=1 Tax=Virgibacillus kekensis TaxID=202261 RepID=A0ABV9DKH6_9BACI